MNTPVERLVEEAFAMMHAPRKPSASRAAFAFAVVALAPSASCARPARPVEIIAVQAAPVRESAAPPRGPEGREEPRLTRLAGDHYRARRGVLDALLSEMDREEHIAAMFSVHPVDDGVRQEYGIDHEVVLFPYAADVEGPPFASLLTELGFEPGDRLRTVNGFAVAPAVNALQAYVRLKHAKTLLVRFVRAGRARTCRIELTD